MAISFAFVSFFVPCISFDYLDVLEKNGYKNPEIYCKIEYSPFIIHFIGYDYRDSENPNINHNYRILYGLIPTQKGKGNLGFSGTTDYDIAENNKNLLVSGAVFDFLSIIGLILFIVLFFYFCYNIIRNQEYNTRYLLYEAILMLTLLIIYPVSLYYSYKIIDIKNLGFANSLIIEYGFYMMVVSTILFFTSYLLKKHFF